MALENDHTPDEEVNSEECRDPTLTDLIKLCADLNQCGVSYLIVGGFAIIQAGYDRHTKDIDLLVDVSRENEARVVRALQNLPERAIDEMEAGDTDTLGVVRVADEIMVALMKSGCGVTYADAIKDAVWRELDGVRIPFASKPTLWKMKQTVREKDIPDRLFLRQQLEAEGIPLDPPPKKVPRDVELPRWLEWLERRFGKPRR
jgi:hypothetical protein